jgi:DNA-binding transcriptional MerR regulator
MFTIGAFAELTGVSPKKLRHYETLELFKPAWTDPQSHYRYYLAAQIPELQRIVALRDLGISLMTIAALSHGGASLQNELAKRRAELVAERRELEQRLATLEIRFEHSGDRDVVVRKRPAGVWASMRRSVPEDTSLGPLFVEVETVVRESGARAAKPPVAIDHVGDRAGERSIEILIPITRRLQPTGGVETITTPPALVATTIERGGYPALSAAGSWAGQWAAATGNAITGPAWVVYIQFSAEPDLNVPESFLTDEPSEYVTEIQVPIEPMPESGTV